jgi:BlaI family transcriptional regulator, penicillinase repressor
MNEPKTSLPKPTPGELEILRVLWQRGPSSVRDVHETLSATRPAGYTTVLKILQIMTEKRLVTRDTSRRTHEYSAAISQEETQRQLLDDLLHRAFDGSASQLVLQALAGGKASTAEIATIRRLLDDIEGGDK